MKTLRTVLLAAAVIGLGATTALASGGGSMGSGGAGSGGVSNMPGNSGPQYDPAAEYAKAVSAFKAKQYRDAARAAQHVTDAVPKSPDAWRLLGAAKAGDNDWKAARRAYERAVKLAPDEITGHAGLGMALANLKDPKAQDELTWLKAKAQTCADACPDAANLKAMSVMVEGAMTPAATAATPKPSASLSGPMLFGGPMAGEGAYVTAVSLINQKRYDEALASLAGAQAKFGLHPDILTYEGYAWRKKGDYARAEQFYRQALALDPAHIGAIEYYGELKVATGDLGGAKKLLARLDGLCTYGCADAEELRRWIALGHEPQ
ncbi:MAG: tetratricopeptide repeat protein [Phenylobacterium sp.]|nr:MAG: tetratricopeptide repeat protein [Phenylobacterium sp.]